MQTLDFGKFDYTDSDIEIPENTIFYRGVPKNIPEQNLIRDLPMYLGSEPIAKAYGEQVIQIKTTRKLRLIDFRKMKNIVRLMLSSRPKVISMSKKAQECIFFLTIAFGYCSYEKQIDLLDQFLKHNMKHIPTKELAEVQSNLAKMKEVTPLLSQSQLNPFEPEGVRIAETYIDGNVMLILKAFFKDMYHGYIAPQMFSPFHTNNGTHEEVVIFDPIKAGLAIMKPIQNNKYINNIKSITLQKHLSNTHKHLHIEYNDFSRNIFRGGNTSKPKPITNILKTQDRNAFFEDETYKKPLRKAIGNIEHIAKYCGITKETFKPCNLNIKGEPVIPRPQALLRLPLDIEYA